MRLPFNQPQLQHSPPEKGESCVTGSKKDISGPNPGSRTSVAAGHWEGWERGSQVATVAAIGSLGIGSHPEDQRSAPPHQGPLENIKV